jgi:hypothetical protein
VSVSVARAGCLSGDAGKCVLAVSVGVSLFHIDTVQYNTYVLKDLPKPLPGPTSFLCF